VERQDYRGVTVSMISEIIISKKYMMRIVRTHTEIAAHKSNLNLDRFFENVNPIYRPLFPILQEFLMFVRNRNLRDAYSIINSRRNKNSVDDNLTDRGMKDVKELDVGEDDNDDVDEVAEETLLCDGIEMCLRRLTGILDSLDISHDGIYDWLSFYKI
jgi:hypothetical protein